MKRRLLIIALILWTGLQILHGQFLSSYGLKAGISVADQTYRLEPIDLKLNTEAVLGPGFSVFMEAFRGNHFSLQVDLSYFLKGSKTSTQSVTVDHLHQDRIVVNEGEMKTSTFSYLSISPLARYRIGRGSLQPYFLLGPRVDILLKYQTDSDYPLEEQNNVIPGLTFGTGLEYGMNKVGVFAEFQFQGDIMPVTGQDPLLVNNHMFSLTLGIRWFVAD
jgi:hypothetical protein